MPKYLFSNILGTFLFDENFKVIERVLYKGDEDRDYTKELPAEKKLMQKHKEAIKPADTKTLKRASEPFEKSYRHLVVAFARYLLQKVEFDNNKE